MDGSRFDTLTKTLSAPGSRRRVLHSLLAGGVGLLSWPDRDDATAHDLTKKCKKKSGAAKKKCANKAKKHAATHARETPLSGNTCTPNCMGKTCGSDGCHGSCGTCAAPQTCQGGQCTCPPETPDFCGGTCRPACGVTHARRPDPDCGCCGRANTFCSVGGDCCSGTCLDDPVLTGGSCRGGSQGETCEFNGQCYYNVCTDGFCRCPSGKEACRSNCWDPCPEGQTRNPESCDCCRLNGSNCASAPSTCCASDTNSTQCVNDTCVGRPDGQSCEFDAQCANSRFGCTGGKCGGVNE